jgi:hypothetical protein
VHGVKERKGKRWLKLVNATYDVPSQDNVRQKEYWTSMCGHAITQRADGKGKRRQTLNTQFVSDSVALVGAQSGSKLMIWHISWWLFGYHRVCVH